MPKVPFDPIPDGGLNTAPLTKQNINPSAASFGGGLAAGLEDVGGALEQQGGALAQHAIAFQQINNKAEGDNLYTEYLNKTNTINYGDGKTPGFFDLKGATAMAAFPKARESLMAVRDEIAGKATNPIVQQLFDTDSRRLASYSLGDMSRHAASERQSYIKDTSNGVIASAENDIGLNFHDTQRVNHNLAVINGQLTEQAGLEGWSPEKLASTTAIATSKGLSTVIQRTADEDPFRARDMYRMNSDKFTAADSLHLDNFFKTTLNPLEGYNTAHTIVNGNVGIPDASTFAKVLETAGEKSAPGSVSPKGAAGVMQVIPATAKATAKELGIDYKPELMSGTTPEAIAYQRQIGEGYSSSLMRQFGGNAVVASAAYNAGPGIVRDWINGTNYTGKNSSLTKLGNPSTGEAGTAQWAANIPFAETKAYTQRIATALNLQPGVQPKFDDPKAHLNEYLAQGQVAAQYAHPGDVLYAHTVDTQIRAAVGQASSAVTAQKVGASNNITTALMGGPDGSGPKPGSISDLYNAYPGAKQDWMRLDPKAQESFLKQLAGNASGRSIPETPDTMKKVASYKGMAVNDPDQFKGVDFAHAADLPYSDRKTLMDLQTKISTKAPINPGLTHAMTVANTVLAGTITKKDNPEEYNNFTGRLSQSIDGFIAVHIRKPNDNDIRKMTQELALDTNSGFLGFGKTKAYESPYASLVSGVPDADARKIVAAHKTAFGTDPSSDTINYWYQRKLRGGQ